MGHDYEGALAAQVVDQELEEGVDGEGLVNVAYWIDPLREREGDETNPRGYRVDGNPFKCVSETVHIDHPRAPRETHMSNMRTTYRCNSGFL